MIALGDGPLEKWYGGGGGREEGWDFPRVAWIVFCELVVQEFLLL